MTVVVPGKTNNEAGSEILTTARYKSCANCQAVVTGILQVCVTIWELSGRQPYIRALSLTV